MKDSVLSESDDTSLKTGNLTWYYEGGTVPDGVVKRHHLVSRVLLKQWLDSHPNSSEVSCYNIARDKVELVGPKGISWRYEKLHPSNPHGFENFWQNIESEVESILFRINNGSMPQGQAWDNAIKDLMAIHLVRSITYVKNHQMRFHSAIDNLDLSNVPDNLLETAFMNAQDGVVSNTSAQRALARQYYRNYLKLEASTGSYHPDAMNCMYPFFRTSIMNRKCILRRIPEALKDSTFLVGDCPVLPLTISNGQRTIATQLFGPEIETYVFPIGPKVSVELSNVTSEQETSLKDIELLNELQIRNAEYEIVWDIQSHHHLETVRRVRVH